MPIKNLMNIDKLLDIRLPLSIMTSAGKNIQGIVVEVAGEESFLFSPDEPEKLKNNALLKITDGRDSAMVRVIESTESGIVLSIETQVKPPDERREDVRINDKIFYKATFLGHGHESEDAISKAMAKINTEKLIINSFLKGRYGMSGSDELSYSMETRVNPEIWEINRKLDLVILMSVTEDFKELIRSVPRDANICAGGIRFLSQTAFDVMDIIEISMVLPMSPILYIRLVAEVIRVKTIAVDGKEQHSIVARFYNMDPEMKEDIVHYIFKRQREILRRRMDIER